MNVVDLTCPTCKGTGGPDRRVPYGCCGDCQGAGRLQPTLDQWDALVAERDTLASKVQAVLELVSDESWHVGGAWGDYGEPVLLARNVAEALGKDYDESREDRSADFAANVAEAQEAAYLAEAERDTLLKVNILDRITDEPGWVLSLPTDVPDGVVAALGEVFQGREHPVVVVSGDAALERMGPASDELTQAAWDVALHVVHEDACAAHSGAHPSPPCDCRRARLCAALARMAGGAV